MQVSNKSMLESAEQIKKIDLVDYVFNHQWFKVVTSVVLRKLQNTNSTILPTKTPPGNPTNDQWLSTKKKKKKKEKEKKLNTFLQAFTRNFSCISLSCIIHRTSTDHALID